MTPDAFGALLDSFARLPYGGEAIDQRTHALQTAGAALADGRDDAFVLACALHDVARALASSEPHDIAGERIVRALLGMRAGRLVGGHVLAKRYLVSVDPSYVISPASQASLARQGAALDPHARRAFEASEDFAAIVAFRRYDDAAKVPDAPAPSVADLVAIYARFVA